MVTGTDSSREKHPHIRQMHTVTSTGLDSKKEEQQCRDKRDLQVLLLFFLVSSHHRLNEPTTESLYFGFIASLNATLAKCVSHLRVTALHQTTSGSTLTLTRLVCRENACAGRKPARSLPSSLGASASGLTLQCKGPQPGAAFRLRVKTPLLTM